MNTAATSLPRIGVLGASRIVQKALLTPAAGLFDVVAVAARDAERAGAFAREHGIAASYGSYEELVGSPDVDVVYVALPNALHLPWAEQALVANKHVFCEKPLHGTPDDVRRLVDLARRSGLLFVEAQHSRYHSLYEPFVEALAEVGPLRSARLVFDAAITDPSDIRLDPSLGAGVLLDFGCYVAEWALWLLGGEQPVVEEARFLLSEAGVDLRVDARLVDGAGAPLLLECDMRPEVSFRAFIDVVGTKGRVLFDNPLVVDGSSLSVERDSGESKVLRGSGESTYRAQLRALRAALESGELPPTSGPSLERVPRILERIRQRASTS